jgi:hypothetical protein
MIDADTIIVIGDVPSGGSEIIQSGKLSGAETKPSSICVNLRKICVNPRRNPLSPPRLGGE